MLEHNAMFTHIDQLRTFLTDNGYEDAVVFTDPDFVQAFIGVSHDGRAVYSVIRMIDWLVIFDELSSEDAMDFISSQTIPSLPYMGDKAPIILYDLIEDIN